jgi:hypothetical protein
MAILESHNSRDTGYYYYSSSYIVVLIHVPPCDVKGGASHVELLEDLANIHNVENRTNI